MKYESARCDDDGHIEVDTKDDDLVKFYIPYGNNDGCYVSLDQSSIAVVIGQLQAWMNRQKFD